MKKFIYFFIFFFLTSVLVFSITEPPPCGPFSWNYLEEIRDGKPNQLPNFTITGDSRAKFVSEYGRIGNFANASKDGIPLILPNQIKSIQNLGWASATASDDTRDFFTVIQNYTSGSPGAHKEKTWWRKWDSCSSGGTRYVTHPKTVFNLGGNDMVNFEKFYSVRDGFLGSLTNLVNPSQLLGLGLKKNPFDKEFRWNWAFQLKEEIILMNMKSMASRLLNQSRLHNLILVDIAPRGPAIIFGDKNISLERILRTNVYISRLNRKYYDRLVPELKSKFGDRVHFLDVFNRFYANLVGERGSFYYVLNLEKNDVAGDGIHYGNDGNREFALIITAKMLRLGWFQRDPNITDEMLDSISNGVPIDLSGVCDLKCWATICYLTKFCKFQDLLKMYFETLLDQSFWEDLEKNPPTEEPPP
jgi:hypothetical protein